MFASRSVLAGIYFIACSFSVQGQDVYLRFHSQPEKHNCHFEDTLHATVEHDNEHHLLHLRRNDDLSVNIPLYVTRKNTKGKLGIERQHYDHEENIAVYQDLEHGASVLIQCVNEVSETDAHFLLDGHVHLKNTHYRVEPRLTNGRITLHPLHKNKHAYSLSIQEEEKHACPLHKQQEKGEDSLKASAPQTPIRHKRSTTVPYILDISIHVDTEAYKTWLARAGDNAVQARTTIRRYFTHVTNGVNLRFQSMKPDLDITIRPFKITIHESGSPFIDNLVENRNGAIEVNAEYTLQNLTAWIVENSKDIGDYDHIMLFTAYDLYSSGNEQYTTGLATIGTMCSADGSSVSVVEDRGGFQSIYIATHEIGHGLRSHHDSDTNACAAEDRYIMAPKTYKETELTALNPWKFSNCSIAYMNGFLQELSTNRQKKFCIENTLEAVDIPDISGELAGQVYGPDEQCRHIHGSTSYVCRSRVFGTDEHVCRNMFCKLSSSEACRAIMPAYGTSCGNKKWCEKGECVSNEAAPAREGTCIYGDFDGILPTTDDLTCNKIRIESNFYCYLQSYVDLCCETCSQIKTDNQNCLYGDKIKGCVNKNCGFISTITNKSYAIECCGTCKNVITTTTPASTTVTTVPTSPTKPTPSCSDLPKVNQMTCRELLNTHGIKQCYSLKIFTACCTACTARRENVEGCPFGDKSDQCDVSNCGKKTATGDYSDDCCKTCAVVTPGASTVESTSTVASTPTVASVASTSTVASSSTTTPAPTCKDDSNIADMTCTEYITTKGKAQCYSAIVLRSCCLTCNLFKTPSKPGCEFGDKVESCSTIDFSQFETCGGTSAKECCDSCSTIKPTPSPNCTDSITGISGVTCHDHVAKEGKTVCYDTNVKTSCCKSCHFVGDHTKEGCEYGDQYVAACALVNFTSCSENTKRFCCDKCLGSGEELNQGHIGALVNSMLICVLAAITYSLHSYLL